MKEKQNVADLQKKSQKKEAPVERVYYICSDGARFGTLEEAQQHQQTIYECIH